MRQFAVREYAFETQTFVVNCGMYAPPESVPDDFAYKSVGNWKWAVGGSCVVNPFGVYLAEPVFHQEKIVTAEVDFRDRIIAKNIVDCVGHYSRPDILRLQMGPQAPGGKLANRIEEVIDQIKEVTVRLGLNRRQTKDLEQELIRILRE
jgi:hypothetical protein